MELAMNRRAAGVAFCAISAFLFSSRYFVAAIFGSGVKSWSANLFHNMLRYVGSTLTTLSVIALIMGLTYLAVAEFREK
jgi:hypothetical protein